VCKVGIESTGCRSLHDIGGVGIDDMEVDWTGLGEGVELNLWRGFLEAKALV